MTARAKIVEPPKTRIRFIKECSPRQSFRRSDPLTRNSPVTSAKKPHRASLWSGKCVRRGLAFGITRLCLRTGRHGLRVPSINSHSFPHCELGREKGNELKRDAILRIAMISVILGASVSTASAWWQFAANSPSGERQTSPHYGSLKECERALKVAESRLAKKYPDLYPLVGSCEEYR